MKVLPFLGERKEVCPKKLTYVNLKYIPARAYPHPERLSALGIVYMRDVLRMGIVYGYAIQYAGSIEAESRLCG